MENLLVMVEPLEKNKRIVNPKLIKQMKAIGYCERCFNDWKDLETHHIKSKGSGGHDVKDNLVCLCWVCHRMVHDGNISRDELRELVSNRIK